MVALFRQLTKAVGKRLIAILAKHDTIKSGVLLNMIHKQEQTDRHLLR